MFMSGVDIDNLLEIGILLSSEKNFDRLLEKILTLIMALTRSDAGTLYLKEGDSLVFRILRNDTMKSYQGGEGEQVDLPPVPITEKNVCALALMVNRTINIEDVRLNKDYDFSGPIQYDAMTGYFTKSMLVVPMNGRDGESIGVLQLINAKDEEGNTISFSHDLEKIVESVASQTAIALENMGYVKEIKELFHSFVQVLSEVIDDRVPFHATHTSNMVQLGSAFIDYLNTVYTTGSLHFSPEKKEEFLMSVWLHDIGKIITPLAIMNKATRLGYRRDEVLRRFDVIILQLEKARLDGSVDGDVADELLREANEAVKLILKADTVEPLPDEIMERMRQLAQHTFVDTDGIKKQWLTEEEVNCLTIRSGTLTKDEREVMQNHVTATEKLLMQINFSKEYQNVPGWASKHHEFLDGTGYPKQLTRDELPKESRIITILDIFEALTASNRPYKPKMTVDQAIAILMEMADSGKLDIELVGLFIKSQCWSELLGDKGKTEGCHMGGEGS